MKYSIILITLSSILVCLGADLREWTLNDGRFFPATFTEMDGKTVVLASESGKKARFSAEDIGVADRYYLHTEHDVPLEDLEGGNIFTAEQDVKIKASDFKKVTGIKMKGEGYDVSFDAILTPHFLVMHEKGAKPQMFAEELERTYFSHMYRHPDHAALSKGKRGCYLFMKDMKLYEQLGTAFVDQLRKEGIVSIKQINQLEANWAQYPGHNPWALPPEYMKEYDAESRVDIEFASKKKGDREEQIVGFYNLRWQWFWPHRKGIHARVPGGSEQHIKDPKVNSAAYCFIYALVSNNDIRTHDEHWHGAGGGLDQTGKHTMGRYGVSKIWAKELGDKVKKGTLALDDTFSTFYNAPSNDEKDTPKETYRDFGLLCTGVGRFFEHDLRHMFGVCEMAEYMHKKNKFPDLEEMPAIFGYDSVDELDVAFQEFLVKGNAKMKP